MTRSKRMLKRRVREANYKAANNLSALEYHRDKLIAVSQAGHALARHLKTLEPNSELIRRWESAVGRPV